MPQTQTEIDASITRRRAMAASKAEEESLLQIGKRRTRGPESESTSKARWGKDPDFHMPSPMVKRPRSADGKVSIHISFTPVSKQGRPTFGGQPLPRAFGGTPPGQAAAHSEYIERDGAAEVVPEVEHEQTPAREPGSNPNRYMPRSNSPPPKDLTNVFKRYDPTPATPADLAYWRAIAAYQSGLDDDGWIGTARSLSSLCNMPGLNLVSHNQPAHVLLPSAQSNDMGSRNGTPGRVRSQGKGRGGIDSEAALGGLAQAARSEANNPSYQQPSRAAGTPNIRYDELAAQVLLGQTRAAEFGEDLTETERAIMGAQERASDGTLLLFSNIHEDAFMRTEYWRAVERCEATPKKHAIEFDTLTSPDWWEQLTFDTDTPAILKRHLEPALQSIRAAIDAGEPPPRLAPMIVTEEQAGEALLWSAAQPGRAYSDSPLAFKSGRGGRTQFRLVTELPHEIDTEARALIVDEFCESLKARGFMYTAVVHAPDLHNDKRNYHLHLVMHDRPARWMDEHDAWDFEVKENYMHKREMRTRHPYRQNKIEEASQDYKASKGADERGGFVEKLRVEFTDISNRVLAADGINKQYDHRSFEKRGIDREPTEHLGPKASALESIGVVTAVGALNAIKIWSGAERTVDKERDKSIFESQERGRTLFDAAGKLPTKDQPAVKAMIAERTMHATNAAECARHLLLLRLLEEKAKSRAVKTRDTCLAHLAEIKSGNADKATRANRKIIERRFLDAQAHIEAIDKANSVDKPLMDGLTAEVEQSLKASEKLDARILAIIVASKFTPAVQKQPTERSMLWSTADTVVPAVDGVRAAWPAPNPITPDPIAIVPAKPATMAATGPVPFTADLRNRRLPASPPSQPTGLDTFISTEPGSPLVEPTKVPSAPVPLQAPVDIPVQPDSPVQAVAPVVNTTVSLAPIAANNTHSPAVAPPATTLPPIAPVTPPDNVPVVPGQPSPMVQQAAPQPMPIATPALPCIVKSAAPVVPVTTPQVAMQPVPASYPVLKPDVIQTPLTEPDAKPVQPPATTLPETSSPRLDLQEVPLPEQADKAIVDREIWDATINRINEKTMLLTDHGAKAQPRFTSPDLTEQEQRILANPSFIKRTNLRLEQIYGKQQFEIERLRKWLLSIEHQAKNFPIENGRIMTAKAPDHMKKLLNRYRAAPVLLEARDAIIKRRQGSTMSNPPATGPTVRQTQSTQIGSTNTPTGNGRNQDMGNDPVATARANNAIIEKQDRLQAEERKAQARRTYPDSATATTPQVRELLEAVRNDERTERRIELVQAIILSPAASKDVMLHGPELASEFWSHSEAAQARIAVNRGPNLSGRSR